MVGASKDGRSAPAGFAEEAGPPDGAAPEAAFAAISRIAAAGDAEAQAWLGQMLLDGRGAPVDPHMAVVWFRRAAQGGHAMGMNMLGRCLENGWGVARDPAGAVAWYMKAAEAGLDWGMYNYATLLTQGEGVEKDLAVALLWFTRAADLGHAKSINVVGGFHEDGWIVRPDRARARECYARAAAGGDFRGHFNYARLLAAEGDLDAARSHFTRAHETATPAFREKMAAFLAGSPDARLRAVADDLNGRADL